MSTQTSEMRRFDWAAGSREDRAAWLTRPATQNSASTYAAVREILASVKREGDAALLRFTREFDGIDHKDMRVSDPPTQKMII